MKTRKRSQTAFPQPDISWSRKRSVTIVKRIQIQATKRKISKTTSRSSPKVMSARGAKGTLLPFRLGLGFTARFGSRGTKLYRWRRTLHRFSDPVGGLRRRDGA